jgi:hypothetical protein
MRYTEKSKEDEHFAVMSYQDWIFVKMIALDCADDLAFCEEIETVQAYLI